MLKKTSTILFYVVAIWCLGVGAINQTLSGVEDLPLLTPTVHDSKRMLAVAGILSVGTVGAQAYSVFSLGAFGPAAMALGLAVFLSVSAPAVGMFAAAGTPGDG